MAATPLSLDSLKKYFNEIKGSLPLNKIYFSEKGLEKSGTACIDCKTWEIEVNPEFVYELMNKGLSEESIYQGLIMHELGHFRHHPFDLETALLEINSLEKKEIPLGIKGLYDDFVCNSRIILEGKDEKVSKVYEVLESDGILQTLNGFYNYLSKKFGLENVFSKNEPTTAEAEKIEKLKEINIKCKRNLHPYYIVQFYEIFKDDAIPKESLSDLLKGLKDQYGEKKLKDVIKKLKDDGKIGQAEADKYCEAVKIPLMDKFEEHVSKSKEYSISVQKLKRAGSKHNTPYSPVKTSVDDIANYDPFISFASGGKAMPGLSNCWLSKEEEFLEEYSTLNDLVLMIDSSGSMINPSDNLSSAVVSAMTIANYYITNDKGVAVVNFSNDTFVNNFSKDKDEVFKKIFQYQGGGTTLTVKNINLDFNSKDVLIITDEAIHNYNEAVNFLKSKRSENNHTYIISITSENSETKDDSIRRIKIQNPKDIPKIVIGEQE